MSIKNNKVLQSRYSKKADVIYVGIHGVSKCTKYINCDF